MEKRRHGSLFSGIGGFDLAALWMNWENVFQVEISDFCNKVLEHHFPDTTRFRDIKKFKGGKYRGTIDVLSGGFPCQPFSTAGKRRGKDDDRFLWPEALRIIGEIKPRWIVLENVAGLFSILERATLSRMEIKEIELFCAQPDRPAHKTVLTVQRRIIGTIVDQIGAAGYILPKLTDGTPVVSCIPACALGAPHRRDRLWIIAHSGSLEKRGQMGDLASGHPQSWQRSLGDTAQHSHRFKDNTGREVDAYTDRHRQHRSDSPDEEQLHQTRQHALHDPQQGDQHAAPANTTTNWQPWPTQSPFCRRDDGLSSRLDTITFPKWREQSIHSYGNAIVPQAAFTIFQAIEQVDPFKTHVL